MNRIKKALQRVVAPPNVRLRGCTDLELARLERKFGIRLPSSYRELMRVAGKSKRVVFVGSDWTYPCVLELRDAAEMLLKECDARLKLPKSSFVFLMHQGYSFLMFDTEAGDDPPIALFSETDPKFRIVSKAFTTWLTDALNADSKRLRG